MTIEQGKFPRLLNFRQLQQIGISYSREHLWRMERQGSFPRRVRLSPAKIAWIESEVLDWLHARSDARALQEYALHD